MSDNDNATPGANVPPAAEPPTWQPAPPAAPAAPAPPASAPHPARLVRLWQAVVVGAACLVVGLGVGGVFGGLIGFVAGHHDRTVRIDGRFGPGFGNGPHGGPGGMGGFGFGQRRTSPGQPVPSTQPDQPAPPQLGQEGGQAPPKKPSGPTTPKH